MYVTSYTIVTVHDTTAADEAALRTLADNLGADDWKTDRGELSPDERSVFRAYFVSESGMKAFVAATKAMRS